MRTQRAGNRLAKDGCLSEVQAPSDRVPQTLSGNDRDQCCGDDGAGGENDGRPGEQQRHGEEIPDKQFDRHTEDGDFHENIQRHSQE